jgi:uncharacterized membrane protein
VLPGAAPVRQAAGAYLPAVPRSPRALALLCYAFPLLPALALLLIDRQHRFVRQHAAQALLFFTALAVAQLGLLLWLTVLGNLVIGGWPVVALGVFFYVAVVLLGGAAMVWWLRALAAAFTGRAVRARGCGRQALRLEAWHWRAFGGAGMPPETLPGSSSRQRNTPH